MHRHILSARKGQKVDHINRNSLDNRKSNLRLASSSQNAANSKRLKNSKSLYRGVSWDSRCQKWLAQIQVKRKNLFLGRFHCIKQAAKAYNSAAIEFFGEYARLNPI